MLPIAVFLKVGMDGIGEDQYEETVWNLTPLTFRYLYVGLPGLDGVQYQQEDNWLGVALSALMKIPPDRVAWLGAEALRRLVGAPLSEQKRFLLGECVQAYLQMDAQQKQEYEDLLKTETYEGVVAMNKTLYEHGHEQGTETERRRTVVVLLEARFGPLASETRQHLEHLSMDDLWEILERYPSSQSLAELGLPKGDSEETPNS